MRVLFVTNGYPTARHPEFCVFNKEQIESVVDAGVHSEVLFINAREHGRKEYVKAIPGMRRRAADFDLVHCFHGLSFLTARLAQVRTPFVVSFLVAIDNEFRDLPKPVSHVLSKLTRWLLRNGDIGTIFKDRVPEFLAGDPLATHIPNGVDMRFFRPIPREDAVRELGLDRGKRYLLFVSSKTRTRRQKRHDRFREIVSRLKATQEFADVEELVIEGEPRERIPFYFGASEAHVLTSDYEGSPNSVKESLACGVPVIASDVGNVREMIEGIPGCAVLAPEDVEGFVAETRRVLLQTRPRATYADSMRAELRARGLERETAARRLIELYERVLQRSPQGR